MKTFIELMLEVQQEATKEISRLLAEESSLDSAYQVMYLKGYCAGIERAKEEYFR